MNMSGTNTNDTTTASLFTNTKKKGKPNVFSQKLQYLRNKNKHKLPKTSTSTSTSQQNNERAIPKQIQIEVLVHDGGRQDSIVLDALSNISIQALKLLLESRTHIPKCHQYLLCGGHILKDDDILPSNVMTVTATATVTASASASATALDHSEKKDSIDEAIMEDSHTLHHPLCLIDVMKLENNDNDNDENRDSNVKDDNVNIQSLSEVSVNISLEESTISTFEKKSDKIQSSGSSCCNDDDEKKQSNIHKSPNHVHDKTITKYKHNWSHSLKTDSILYAPFDLKTELTKIQCEQFTDKLIQAGFDDRGAFANVQKEELMAYPLCIHGRASDKIIHLSRYHHEQIVRGFAIQKARHTIVSSTPISFSLDNLSLEDTSGNESTDVVNDKDDKDAQNEDESKLQSDEDDHPASDGGESEESILPKTSSSPKPNTERDRKESTPSFSKKIEHLPDMSFYLRENIPHPLPIQMSQEDIISKWMSEIKEKINASGRRTKHVSKEFFTTILMEWMEPNIQIPEYTLYIDQVRLKTHKIILIYIYSPW